MDAETLIEKLGLIKLPEEGGYYREVYRSKTLIPGNQIKQARRQRCCGTDIYYLVTEKEFSGLHMVRNSDEIFNFYLGDPVEMLQIRPNGMLSRLTLGTDLLEGHSPKTVVTEGVWQGMRLKPGGQWALFGCTVMPGFEFEDFVGGTYAELSRQFPQHAAAIKLYTHC